MKRMLSLSLSALLLLSALVGCGGGTDTSGTTDKTPEEYTQAYQSAIESARDDELNTSIPVITSTEDDMAAFGISMSMINTQAYGIVAIMPAEGREQAVLDGLQTHIDSTCRAFEHYIPGNKEIAEATRLETLKDGTILMVMCENQDEIFDAIKAAIEG